MQGLIHYSVETFIRQRRGEAAWAETAIRAGLDSRGFHAFRHYPPQMLDALISAGCAVFGLDQAEFLDDLGQWLAGTEEVRRILRFSGASYADFVFALEHLHLRGEMVLPSLDLPRITVTQKAGGRFDLDIADRAEWAAVICGVARAMADDYGVLAFVEIKRGRIRIDVPDTRFGPGRDFSLATIPITARPV